MIDEVFVALCELGGKAETAEIKQKVEKMYPGTVGESRNVNVLLRRLNHQGWVESPKRGTWRVIDKSLRPVAEARVCRELSSAGLDKPLPTPPNNGNPEETSGSGPRSLLEASFRDVGQVGKDVTHRRSTP